MTPADYLKMPYGRLVMPEEDGTYRAEIPEFPGCIAVGETAATALHAIEEVAHEWLESALARGQSIPPPIDSNSFSGKFVLRLPRSLHKRAAYVADREGVSLNQLIVSCVVAHVSGGYTFRGSTKKDPRPYHAVTINGPVLMQGYGVTVLGTGGALPSSGLVYGNMTKATLIDEPTGRVTHG